VVASLWQSIALGALTFVAVGVAGALLAAFLVVRYGRRKWRALHSHGAVVGAKALWEAAATTGFRRRGTWAPEEVYRSTPRQARQALWRSVDRAEAAVRAASEAGAPTASLPMLCRRLNESAIGIDRLLQVDSTGPVPGAVAAQVVEVMRAAGDVHQAAMASAGDATGQRVRDLVRDADEEIRCLDAGLSSARTVLPPPR
jgi:hypothetical protein